MNIALDKENLRDMLDKLNTAATDSLNITGAPDATVEIMNNEIYLSINGYTVCRIKADLIKIEGYFQK